MKTHIDKLTNNHGLLSSYYKSSYEHNINKSDKVKYF